MINITYRLIPSFSGVFYVRACCLDVTCLLRDSFVIRYYEGLGVPLLNLCVTTGVAVWASLDFPEILNELGLVWGDE